MAKTISRTKTMSRVILKWGGGVAPRTRFPSVNSSASVTHTLHVAGKRRGNAAVQAPRPYEEVQIHAGPHGEHHAAEHHGAQPQRGPQRAQRQPVEAHQHGHDQEPQEVTSSSPTCTPNVDRAVASGQGPWGGTPKSNICGSSTTRWRHAVQMAMLSERNRASSRASIARPAWSAASGRRARACRAAWRHHGSVALLSVLGLSLLFPRRWGRGLRLGICGLHAAVYAGDCLLEFLVWDWAAPRMFDPFAYAMVAVFVGAALALNETAPPAARVATGGRQRGCLVVLLLTVVAFPIAVASVVSLCNSAGCLLPPPALVLVTFAALGALAGGLRLLLAQLSGVPLEFYFVALLLLHTFPTLALRAYIAARPRFADVVVASACLCGLEVLSVAGEALLHRTPGPGPAASKG